MLRDLQTEFLAALLDGPVDRALPLVTAGGPRARRGVAIHAENAAAAFHASLCLAFPAVRRLVGDAYFQQCVRDYRRRHPSRSGDLHHAARAFAQFLTGLHASGPHRYLGDVARLEWLIEESCRAADHSRFDFERLAGIDPSGYDALRLVLSPSLRLFTADIPALSLWRANAEGTAEPAAIDLDAGSDRLLITRTDRRLAFHRIEPGEQEFIECVTRGLPLVQGLDAAAGRDPNFDAAVSLRRLVAVEAIVDFQVNFRVDLQVDSQVV
jgi:hypothetical protein